MMEKLFHNDIWVKVFAVALAILLWAVVMQDQLAPATRTFEIPLHVIAHPIYQVYEGPQDGEEKVEVRVTGQNLVVSRLKPTDLKAEVDYSKITEPGKQVQADIRVTGPESVKSQAQYYVIPKTLAVTLVENRDTEVPVTVEPAAGYVAQGSTEWQFRATPVRSKAPVSGRNDYLRLVSRAVVTLDDKDKVPNVPRITKKVTPLDDNGKPVDKLATTYMDVTFEWTQLPPGKSVSVEPVTQGTLPKGFAVASIDVNPTTVTLRATTVGGPPPAVNAIQTAPIDLTDKTKSFTTLAKLVAPRGTNVATETVTVTVNIGEATAEKVFKGVPITVQGKPATTDATLSVTDVQVKVRGAYSAVTPMEATALTAYVDVENLHEGKHMLPVRVNSPAGVTEMEMDPPVVEVTLIPKP